MRAVLTESFAANLIASPPEVQKAFGKLLTNLLRDLRHPSLRAKKYEERSGLWQARINDDWRCTSPSRGIPAFCARSRLTPSSPDSPVSGQDAVAIQSAELVGHRPQLSIGQSPSSHHARACRCLPVDERDA